MRVRTVCRLMHAHTFPCLADTVLCLGWPAQVVPALFMRRWQVAAVHGKPRSQRFYGAADESSFVREHKCGYLDTLMTVRIGI